MRIYQDILRRLKIPFTKFAHKFYLNLFLIDFEQKNIKLDYLL